VLDFIELLPIPTPALPLKGREKYPFATASFESHPLGEEVERMTGKSKNP
jgi:hypothetical protein